MVARRAPEFGALEVLGECVMGPLGTWYPDNLDKQRVLGGLLPHCWGNSAYLILAVGRSCVGHGQLPSAAMHRCFCDHSAAGPSTTAASLAANYGLCACFAAGEWQDVVAAAEVFGTTMQQPFLAAEELMIFFVATVQEAVCGTIYDRLRSMSEGVGGEQSTEQATSKPKGDLWMACVDVVRW